MDEHYRNLTGAIGFEPDELRSASIEEIAVEKACELTLFHTFGSLRLKANAVLVSASSGTSWPPIVTSLGSKAGWISIVPGSCPLKGDLALRKTSKSAILP
jgi:hypothetical protein